MKNKLAAVLTGTMLIITTNSLPSIALNTPETSVKNAVTKLGTPTNQPAKNTELLLTQRRSGRRRRGGWTTRRIVCRRRRVYNQQQRRWVRVRICRRIQTRVYYPRYY